MVKSIGMEIIIKMQFLFNINLMHYVLMSSLEKEKNIISTL